RPEPARDRRALLLDEVLLRPERDLPKRRNQRLAAVGEGIGNSQRRALVDRAGDEPRLGEVGKAVRQDRVGDPINRARKLAETGRPLAEIAEDHPVPPLAEKLERTRKSGIAARAGVGTCGGVAAW